MMQQTFVNPVVLVQLLIFLSNFIVYSSANWQNLTYPISHANRMILFVAGWPQSGTSMIHKLLSMHPQIATMMEKCREKHGNRCENWNYEGQWLLSNATLRQQLHSGATCAVRSLTKDVQDSIFNEWNPLWESSLPIIIEKSPQSLVKTLALREIFASRGFNVKFLIVIKHPVTINTMTPRKYSWRYEREVVGSNLAALSKNSKIPSVIADKMSAKEISIEQMQENLRYFLQILNHQPQGSDCSLGWIDAYEELLDVLEYSPATFSRESFRIVHYEAFVKPITQCSQIFEFLFSEYPKVLTQHETLQADHKRFCSGLFTRSAQTTGQISSRTKERINISKNNNKNSNKNKLSRTQGANKYSPRRSLVQINITITNITNNINNNINAEVNEDHRSLRLRTDNTAVTNNNNQNNYNKNGVSFSHPFQFHVSLVKQESMKRIQEFFFVTNNLANLDDNFNHARNRNTSNTNMKKDVYQLLSQLETLSPRLLSLGYQLHSPIPVTTNSNNSDYKWAKWVL